MALQVNVLNVSLAGPMNEKTPRELLPPEQMSRVLNGRWLHPGQVETRLGYTSLTKDLLGGGTLTTDTASDAERLLTRNDELCYLNELGISSYSQPVNKWVRRDDVPEPHLDQGRIVSTHASDNFCCSDMAINASGIQCVAWRNLGITGSCSAALLDNNGQLIVRAAFTDGDFPRVLLVGSIFVVVYYDLTGAGHTIRARTIDPSNPTGFSASTSLLTDAQGSPNWDAAAGSSFFVVAYEDTAFELRIRRYNTALSNTHTKAYAGSNVRAVAAHCDGTDVFVAFHNQTSSNVDALKIDGATLTTTSWNVNIMTNPSGDLLVAGPHSDSAYFWVARSGSAVNQVEWRRIRKSDGSLLGELLKSTFNATIASKPFAIAGSGESFICVRVARGQGFQEGLVCCALGEGAESLSNYKLRPVAKWLNGKVWWQEFGGVPINYLPQGAVTLSNVYLAHTEKNFLGTRGSHVTVTKLSFGAANRWARIEDRDTALIAGGMLHQYDGDLCSEVPFAYYPYATAPTRQAGGSLTIGTNGLYEYRVCYEWTDARGRVHRSTPSDIETVNTALTAGNQKIRLTIPYLMLTSRSDVASAFASPVAIVVYRRGPDASGATPFVRLVSTGTTQAAGTFPVNTLTGTAGLTFDDDGAAWTTTNQPELYTEGGVLENVPAPSCKVVAKWDNRIWVGGCENPNAIWFSRELVEGEPPYWHENQQILCEEKVTALVSFDSALVVFSRDAIWAMQGHGPSDKGEGSTYTGLAKLPSEVGCTDWRSLCVTEDGVFFQHRPGEGIYLLDRSLSVSYIGAPIENHATELYPTVTSVVAVPSEDEVRFSATNGVTGRLLVYNTLVKQWMVHQLYNTLELDPRDALLWQGAYFWCKNGVFALQSATYRDYDTPTNTEQRIPLEVETGDISIDGPLGRDRQWRVLFLARKSTLNSHALDVSFAYDQSDTYVDTKEWTAAQIAALSSSTHEALEVVAKSKQEARSVRVRVRTRPGNSNPITEAAKFLSLAFEFGKEEGLAVLPAAQKR